MRFRVLGPLRVDGAGSLPVIRAGQQRTVLALLALEAGRVLSTCRLIDELWGARVPPSAVRTVQGYVFRLRRVLGPGVLQTRRQGYELTVPPESVDANLFDQLLAQGALELAQGSWDGAIQALTRALALWRGPALTDVPAGKTLTEAARRLTKARAQAIEDRLVALGKLVRQAPASITIHYGQSLAMLPADVTGFAGREADLHRLDTLAQHDPRIPVIAISAAAGTGKTALAVHWAHRHRARFGDGQLFINLRGRASGPPVQPLDALAKFLRAMGLRDRQIPMQVDEAAELYREMLADRRCLVVLDNVADDAQLQPLLPGGSGNLVLVTSRDTLIGPVTMNLQALTPADAELLLLRVLDKARLLAEPRAVSELAALCGYLPLPLRIAAAELAAQPWAGVGDLTALLRRDRSAMRAVFDVAYRALPEPARRLFRWLGLPAIQDFSVPATAALAGIDEPSTAAILHRLAAAGLVDGQPDGGYAMHDLVRSYAAEKLTATQTAAEKVAAIWRLHSFYLARAETTTNLIYPR
jgi:hypothetical protein